MNIQLSEIAKALGTTVKCEKTIGRISIDSRDTDENTLFFAIKGERFDGHDFIKDVAEKGVGAVVCHKKTECSAPVIYVEDTKKAFLNLASYYRCSMKNLTVVGLTGSVGKTTTKEMIACVLGAKSITLKIDSTSSIKLTANTYLTNFLEEDSTYSNIDFNGYKLFVNEGEIK